jgi:hypothetical protein
MNCWAIVSLLAQIDVALAGARRANQNNSIFNYFVGSFLGIRALGDFPFLQRASRVM